MKYLKEILKSIISGEFFSISEISQKINASEGMVVDSLRLLEEKGFLRKNDGKFEAKSSKCFHCSMGNQCSAEKGKKAVFYEVTEKGRYYAIT